MKKDEFSNIKSNEGKIIEKEGKKIAIYKDKKGKMYTYSAVCQHLGCIINWNSKEKTFDCPCHGSRYSNQGKVIHGPANKNLKAINLKEVKNNKFTKEVNNSITNLREIMTKTISKK